MKKIALLALAAPLVLAACGGGSNAQVKVDPLAYVKDSAHKTAQKSEHMTLNAKMAVGPMSLSMDGSGDFSTEPRAGSMALSFSAMGHGGTIQEVIDGTTIYMSSPLFTRALPAGKKWMKIDLAQLAKAKGINMQSLMSQSPSEGLERLEAAGTVSEVGTETIDGVATTHYQVTNLDPSKLPQGAKLSALGHFIYGPIDVWIGDDNGYVYREKMLISYAVNGQSGDLKMTINLSKFGEPVHVSVPPASETLDASNLPGFGG